jgi:hypothetical protein
VYDHNFSFYKYNAYFMHICQIVLQKKSKCATLQ